MRHMDRGLDARVLEDVFGVVEQGGVLADALAVGLEIHHIHLHPPASTDSALTSSTGSYMRTHAVHRSSCSDI